MGGINSRSNSSSVVRCWLATASSSWPHSAGFSSVLSAAVVVAGGNVGGKMEEIGWIDAMALPPSVIAAGMCSHQLQEAHKLMLALECPSGSPLNSFSFPFQSSSSRL